MLEELIAFEINGAKSHPQSAYEPLLIESIMSTQKIEELEHAF